MSTVKNVADLIETLGRLSAAVLAVSVGAELVSPSIFVTVCSYLPF